MLTPFEIWKMICFKLSSHFEVLHLSCSKLFSQQRTKKALKNFLFVLALPITLYTYEYFSCDSLKCKWVWLFVSVCMCVCESVSSVVDRKVWNVVCLSSFFLLNLIASERSYYSFLKECDILMDTKYKPNQLCSNRYPRVLLAMRESFDWRRHFGQHQKFSRSILNILMA